MELRSLFSLNGSDYLRIFENIQEEIHIHELVRNEQGKVTDLIFKYIKSNKRRHFYTINKVLCGYEKS